MLAVGLAYVSLNTYCAEPSPLWTWWYWTEHGCALRLAVQDQRSAAALTASDVCVRAADRQPRPPVSPQQGTEALCAAAASVKHVDVTLVAFDKLVQWRAGLAPAPCSMLAVK